MRASSSPERTRVRRAGETQKSPKRYRTFTIRSAPGVEIEALSGQLGGALRPYERDQPAPDGLLELLRLLGIDRTLSHLMLGAEVAGDGVGRHRPQVGRQ